MIKTEPVVGVGESVEEEKRKELAGEKDPMPALQERLEQLTDPEVVAEGLERTLETMTRENDFARSSLSTRSGIAAVTGELGGVATTPDMLEQSQELMQETDSAVEKLKQLDKKRVAAAVSEGVKEFLKENKLTLTPLMLGPLAAMTGGSVAVAAKASAELTVGMYALDKVLDQVMDSAEQVIPPQYLVALIAGTTNLAELGASQASAIAGDPIYDVGATPLGSNPTNLYLTGFAAAAALKERAVKEGIIKDGKQKLGVRDTMKVLKSMDWQKMKKQGGMAALFAADAMTFQFLVRPSMKQGNFVPLAAWGAMNAPLLVEYFRRTTFSKGAQVGNFAEAVGDNQIKKITEQLDIDQVGFSPLFEMLQALDIYREGEDSEEKKESLLRLRQTLEKLKGEVAQDGKFRRTMQQLVSGADMKDLESLLKIAGVGQDIDLLGSVPPSQLKNASSSFETIDVGDNAKQGQKLTKNLIKSFENYRKEKDKKKKPKLAQELQQQYEALDVFLGENPDFTEEFEKVLYSEGVEDFRLAYEQLKTGGDLVKTAFQKINNLGVLQMRNLERSEGHLNEQKERLETITGPLLDLASSIKEYKKVRKDENKRGILIQIKLQIGNLQKRGELDESFAAQLSEVLGDEYMGDVKQLFDIYQKGEGVLLEGVDNEEIEAAREALLDKDEVVEDVPVVLSVLSKIEAYNDTPEARTELLKGIKGDLRIIKSKMETNSKFRKKVEAILFKKKFKKLDNIFTAFMDEDGTDPLAKGIDLNSFKDSNYRLHQYSDLSQSVIPEIVDVVDSIGLWQDTKDADGLGKVMRNQKSQIESALKKLTSRMDGSDFFAEQINGMLSTDHLEPFQDILSTLAARQRKVKNVTKIVAGMTAVVGLSAVLDSGVTDMADALPWLGKGAAGFFIMSFFSSIGEYLTTSKYFKRGQDEDAIKNIADSNAINAALAPAAIATSAAKTMF
jgi:predicted component of type VI protein secretion system